jgi:class 3 adenylate cyclase
MKFLSTFRARLILTIFPIVAGITTGALLLAERKFSVTYQKLFEEQFENQIGAVTQAKNKRFEALSSVLERLAENPEVLSSMGAKDYLKASMILRPSLEALARERLQNEFGNAPLRADARAGVKNALRPERRDLQTKPGLPAGGGAGSPFIALIDAGGDFITQPRPRPGKEDAASQPVDSPVVSRRSSVMPWLGKRELSEVLTRQEVGYLIVEAGEKRGEQVREVFITPLREPGTEKLLGALLFGLPLPALADRALYEQTRRNDSGEILGGIYVEGRLVSGTVPENQKDVIAAAMEESLRKSSKERRQILVPIDGVQHRLIYRILNPDSPFPQAAQVNFYSLAPLHDEIHDLRRSAAGLGLLALAVALLLVTFVSRGLSGPVSSLVAAAQEVEKGNYEVRVPVTRDELGRLSQSFNDMAAGLALQEKYRSVLNAVADRTIAGRLIDNPGALGGELREVTMLFCDIRGFTALTEKMPPHEVIELLNEHMTALTDVAYAHGGTVDKFVGDLIMVLFGAPEGSREDTLSAVRCAQAMQARRRVMNTTARHPLEIGIGLATGTVVAGCMGSDKRLSYTVLGHHVNLASRLCGIAQAGEIIADPATVEAVGAEVSSTPLPPMQLKGFSEPVQPHRIQA